MTDMSPIRSASTRPDSGADAPADKISAPPKVRLKSDRTTPERRYTSAAAFEGPEPEEDDPLLAFAPYIHTAPRSNSITPKLQRRFVAHLAATGIVKQAARRIGKSIEALYKLRHRPGTEEFSAAWDAALERGVTRLEDCALERSLQGVSTPIVSQGQILGWWDKPDNGLLRFLLQHRLPQRYGTEPLQPGNPAYDTIEREILARLANAQEESAEVYFDDLVVVLNRMVESRIAGGAYADGLNGARSLAEAAAQVRLEISSAETPPEP